MTQQYEQEVIANLSRAEESVQAARVLATAGYFDFAASRAYYAAFYAATAALLSQGLEFSKHSGVIAAFHQRLSKTGKLPKELGKNLNWLFELRNIGDYGETRHVPLDDAERAIKAAEEFLRAIKKFWAKVNLSTNGIFLSRATYQLFTTWWASFSNLN